MIVAPARELIQATRLQGKQVLSLPVTLRLNLLELQTLSELCKTKCACRVNLHLSNFDPERP